MKEIFEYLDYRDYLREFYEENKRRNYNFSYRYISRRTGVNPGYLVTVLKGKNHLSDKYLDAFVRLCRLTPTEKEFFETLFLFSKAKGETEIGHLYEKLDSLKAVRTARVKESQYRFYTEWYYSALRSLLGFYKFDGNYETLGQQLLPPISAEMAQEGVELLVELKLLSWNDEGGLDLSDPIITTGKHWGADAIKEFQRQTIDLASEALVSISPEKRDISTITLAIPESQVEEIREMASEFRKSVLKFVNDSEDKEEIVYQMNLQMFPLSCKQSDS